MGNGYFGSSGLLNLIQLTYETRKIVVAHGIDFRDDDIKERQKQGYGEQTLVDFMQSQFTTNFTLIDAKHMEYISADQQVKFSIEVVHSKEEFKTALNTPDIHVIYQGHSRYGRGSCFDPDAPSTNYIQGERWEQGDSNRNGLYRLGYPYVPIPFEDMEHHQYHFSPVPVEEPAPSYSERHPDARVGLSRITLPESLRGNVAPGFESHSNRYWGCLIGGEKHILLIAGWENTKNTPFDLGATEIKCKTFCHFGCSSKLHYWKIVRDENYKNWKRDAPPTDRFAYFTSAPADYRGYCYWLFYLLKYSVINNNQSWWDSLEYAKKNANRLLRSERAHFQIY
jgi:hypothetical protein